MTTVKKGDINFKEGSDDVDCGIKTNAEMTSIETNMETSHNVHKCGLKTDDIPSKSESETPENVDKSPKKPNECDERYGLCKNTDRPTDVKDIEMTESSGAMGDDIKDSEKTRRDSLQTASCSKENADDLWREKCARSFLESTERMMRFAEILYKCKLCTSLPSILTSKSNFLSHVRDFHLKGNSADEFDCDECELNFRTSEDLNLHIAVCHGASLSCENDGSIVCSGDDTENLIKSDFRKEVYKTDGGITNMTEICDTAESHTCRSGSDSDSDDSNDLDPSTSSKHLVSNYEIQSSKPKMFNFSGGRSTKSRDRKSVPKKHTTGECTIRPSDNFQGRENVFVECRDTDNSLFAAENSRKRKLPNMANVLSPTSQTHTIHWGRGPSELNSDEKGEKSESLCKKIKILDQVVEIPNPNCVDEPGSNFIKIEPNSNFTLPDADCQLQEGQPSQAIPAIHDMQKYSKYLSRKSFFNAAAHQKLKSSAIYNLISTHMQQETEVGEGNDSNLEENARPSDPAMTAQEEKVAPNERFHTLSSASDRLKSFIKHRNEDKNKIEKSRETKDQVLKSFVKIASTEKEHAKPFSCVAELARRSKVATNMGGTPSEIFIYKPKNLDKFVSKPPMCLENIEDGPNVSESSKDRDIHQQQTDTGKQNLLPSASSSPYMYKCFKCDEYFISFSEYCGHFKRMHNSDLPYGTPIPKMEQSMEIVKVIQSILVATHSGHVGREALLKEVADHIGCSQVVHWGAACNRAVKEVFPYSQTLRKGKYKNTYYFGLKFVDKSKATEEEPTEPDELEERPVQTNRQPRAPKEPGVDLERIHKILPELLTWQGGDDVCVPRTDLVKILCEELNESESGNSWGWQCNRAVRLYFPQVVIERRGKFKLTYFQGLVFKDPMAIKYKLAEIMRRDADHSDDIAVDNETNEKEGDQLELSDTSDSETPLEEAEDMKVTIDDDAHKALKQRVCRAIANTKGPLTTPRAVQKKLNNVSTVNIKAMLEVLHKEGYGTIQKPQQLMGRNKIVFFKSYPGTMKEEDLLYGTGISAEQYKENFLDVKNPPVRGMYHRHPQADLMVDLL